MLDPTASEPKEIVQVLRQGSFPGLRCVTTLYRAEWQFQSQVIFNREIEEVCDQRGITMNKSPEHFYLPACLTVDGDVF